MDFHQSHLDYFEEILDRENGDSAIKQEVLTICNQFGYRRVLEMLLEGARK